MQNEEGFSTNFYYWATILRFFDSLNDLTFCEFGFFPKKTDFRLIDENEIRGVEFEINNRPVRKFGFLSANELFSLKKVSVAFIS